MSSPKTPNSGSPKDTGIVNIHGKEYKTVAKRVDEFRKEYKLKMAIITSLVSIDQKTVVMKAAIIDENQRTIATGYAEENRTASQINKTSALENCETSAIGRALANLGLGGGEYASADEVANAINQQNAAKNKAQTTKTYPKNNIDFQEIRDNCKIIDDLNSLQDYYKGLHVEKMSPAQQNAINGIINKRKKELEH